MLGREATLRKTMLDDCKGEKLEEILLLFSAVVVRKQILPARRKQHFSIAKDLAVAKTLTKSDLANFGPLSLAYRASLTKSLNDRAGLDHIIHDFQQKLQERREEYHKRQLAVGASQDASKDELSPEAATNLRRELRQNWVGGIDGCEALLAGADVASTDAYLDLDFDSLWQHFRQSTTPKVHQESVSLLETLQSRVVEQNERLRLWKAYREVSGESKGSSTPARTTREPLQKLAPAALGLNIFNRHQNIRAEHTSAEPADVLTSDSAMHYDQVVSIMKQNLSEVSKKKRKQHNGPSRYAKATPSNGARRMNSAPKAMPIPVFLAGSDMPKEDLFSPLKRPLPSSTNSTPIMERNEMRRPYSTMARTQSQPMATPLGSTNEQSVPSPLSSVVSAIRQPVFTEDRSSLRWDQEQIEAYSARSPGDAGPVLAEEPVSPNFTSAISEDRVPAADSARSIEERLVRISLDEPRQPSPSSELPDYSPPPTSSPPLPIPRHQSPQQPTLSERARLSMAFRSSSTSNPAPSTSPPLPLPTPSPPLSRQSRQPSLADRTLNSINLPRRPTTRDRPHSSFFPASTTFSTPVKNRNSIGGTRDTTPRDKLFDEDAEYASVFKSRPKIAMSPVLSPAFGVQGDEVLGDGEGDVMGGEESMVGLQSSPLGKFGL